LSKLADRIRKATRLQPQPLGFVTARSAAQATMLLAAVGADSGAAEGLARNGADVVIIGSADAPARIDSAPAAGDAPVGAWAAGAAEDEARQLREAGYDFVVFDPDRASATAMLDEETGYVLRLPADLTDVETRALEGFRLDAIDIGAVGGTLTVRRQIDLQRLFALTRKPLMASVPRDISPAELRALRDANVCIVATDDGGAIEELRKKIDGLPPRSRRREESDKPTPFVPRAAAMGGGEDDDDGDDD
jgi:hypothetical protein